MPKKRQNRILMGSLMGLVIFGFSFQVSQASTISRENVVDLVNYSRLKNGLNALVENAKLNQAAMEKADDMFKHNYFSHTSPQNVTPWFWFEKNRYDYQSAGENLAINFQSAEDEHAAWMESADHKKNILNPKYQEIGVAVKKGTIDDRLAIVTVQLFGAREDFQAVLGQSAPSDSLALLNRELESGPWGKLAFVQTPVQNNPVSSKQDLLQKYGNSKIFNLNREQWIAIFQMSVMLIILIIMIVNPILVAGVFIQSRKKLNGQTNMTYPVKIILAK